MKSNYGQLYEISLILLKGLDSGVVLSIDETLAHIKDESILEWLSNYIPLLDTPRFNEIGNPETIEMLQSQVSDIRLMDLGISKNGLVALMYYTVELMQKEKRSN